MWFDATQIDYSEFAGFLTLETLPAPETGDFKKTAFDLCGLVEARVGASSRHLHCEAESPEGRTIVDSYVMKNGNRLHIEEVDGTHREAAMEVDGEYFYGTGAIGEPLTWKAISLEEYSGLHLQWLWLGTHPMYESRAEYKGTLGEEAGDFYVFTYQAPHPSRWPATQGQDTQCQIGFQFDPQGSFLWLTTFAPPPANHRQRNHNNPGRSNGAVHHRNRIPPGDGAVKSGRGDRYKIWDIRYEITQNIAKQD